jgi:hypothetical protein
MSTLPTKQYDHPVNNLREADGTPQGSQLADVTPLHPPGTFSRNTDGGDIINGMANRMGIKPPANVIKFPRK